MPEAPAADTGGAPQPSPHPSTAAVPSPIVAEPPAAQPDVSGAPATAPQPSTTILGSAPHDEPAALPAPNPHPESTATSVSDDDEPDDDEPDDEDTGDDTGDEDDDAEDDDTDEDADEDNDDADESTTADEPDDDTGDDAVEGDDEDEDTDSEPVHSSGSLREQRRRERAQRDRTVFGPETWGVSERHRTAALNEDRLGRFGLPILRTERELAEWLGIPLSRLRWYTHDRAADTTWHYIRYAVPKRNGGERVILAPKRELKALQRKVLSGILANVPAAPSAHGFVPGRSILTNARPHAGRQVVLKLDLKDFFPSVTFPRVRGLFIALGYSFSLASTLALLCTEYDREAFDRDGTRYYISIGPRHLVQGAPTSPALANLVTWRLDRRLGGLATKRGFTYTRYADDLTFSGDDLEAVHGVRSLAQRIVAEERFAVNPAKTRIARRAARQIVTGLVVNERVATPRELRRRLRAILHNARNGDLAAQNRAGRSHFRAYLQGLIAFVHAANPAHAARLRASLYRASAGTMGDSEP